jgi:xanthine/CO dehydrogenase XdhC/CoxF family maturation factor
MAKMVMKTGRPSLRHYDAGDDDDLIASLGLGCTGRVDILIQPVNAGPWASLQEPLTRLLAGDSPLAIATVVSDGPDLGAVVVVGYAGVDGTSRRTFGSLGAKDLDEQVVARATAMLADGESEEEHIGGREVFVEVLGPPPQLVVCGAGTDSIPLVAYAADAGFRVTVLDHREGLLLPKLFPQAIRLAVARPGEPETIVMPPSARTLAVVKAHSLAHDREWVRRLLEHDVPYIGVLGPRYRTDRILRDINANAIMPEARSHVFGPVGLDIGADGPQQVALSIVAELLAFVSKREPRHMSQRHQEIHAD